MVPQDAQSIYSFRKVSTEDHKEYQKVIEIRAVLVEPGYETVSQQTGDQECQIYLLYHGTQAVATIRTRHIPKLCYTMERFAVKKQCQKGGHGLEILKRGLQQIIPKLEPGEEINGASRPAVFGFHAKSGFFPVGPFFIYNGAQAKKMVYMPHFAQKL